MKRILSVCIVFVMILSSLSVTVFAADEGTADEEFSDIRGHWAEATIMKYTVIRTGRSDLISLLPAPNLRGSSLLLFSCTR